MSELSDLTHELKELTAELRTFNRIIAMDIKFRMWLELPTKDEFDRMYEQMGLTK